MVVLARLMVMVPSQTGFSRSRFLGRVGMVQATAERHVHEHGQRTDGGNATAKHVHSDGICTAKHLPNHSTQCPVCQLRIGGRRDKFPESQWATRMNVVAQHPPPQHLAAARQTVIPPSMLSGISLVCFGTSYLVALALEISRLFFRLSVRLVVLLAFAAMGLALHTVYLGLRAQSGVAAGNPLSSWHDWFLMADATRNL